MRMAGDKLRDRLRCIPPYQMHLVDVAQETIAIIFLDERFQLRERIGRKCALLWHGHRVRVFFIHTREPFETVKTVDAPSQVLGLEHSSKLCPSHHTKAFEDAALHHGSFYGHHKFENLVQSQETFEMLSAHVFWKVLEFDFNGVRTPIEYTLDVFTDFLFSHSTKLFHAVIPHSRNQNQRLRDSPPALRHSRRSEAAF